MVMPSISSLKQSRNIDSATLIGICAALTLVLIGIVIGGGGSAFWDTPSFLIVVGGTLGATLVNFSIKDFTGALATLRPAFIPDHHSAERRMHRILQLNAKARSGGVLSLQEEAHREHDPFLKKGLELLVDELPADDLQRILSLEIEFLSERHQRGANIFQTMGTTAPAMGLISTLIGLVQMLRNLEDTSSIGPAMSLALIGTFYGALLSNIVFLPLAGKLRNRSREEALTKELTIEGILCIARNMNPRLTQECLFSFLSPEERVRRIG